MLCQLKCWMKFFFCPMHSCMFFKSTHVLYNNIVMYLLIMYRCFCYNQTITIGSSIQYCLWFFGIHCMILFLILTYYWLERLFYTIEFIAYCLITTMYQYTWICTIFFFGGGGNLGVQFVVFLCWLIKYWIIKSRMNLLATKVILI